MDKDTAKTLGVMNLGVNTPPPNDIIQEFPECFVGTRKLKWETCCASDVPNSLYSLRDKVGQHLEELESQDNIERVNK